MIARLTAPLGERLRGLTTPLRERAEAWLDTLQPRERLLVSVGAVFVLLALLYGVLWHPLALARKHAEERLADARSLAVQLERAGAVARANPGIRGPASGGSLLTVVDQATRSPELGKAPTRLQPDGENTVRVWFDSVPFDNLARWMGQLQSRYGLRVDALDVERQDTPGTVNARLALGRGP